MEECATCNPFVAMVCDEDGGPCLLDTNTVAASYQGQGNLAEPDESPPPREESKANPVAPPLSPRHPWHDCPSPFPACGVSREDALTPLQRAECRECHQGFGHD